MRWFSGKVEFFSFGGLFVEVRFGYVVGCGGFRLV